MVVLRRTQKLAPALPLTASPSAQSDTALGDWYVNRLTVNRRPLLLLVSARGLLPVLISAREVSRLPERLPVIVEARLARLGLPSFVSGREATAMVPAVTAPTTDRSVLGIMTDYMKAIPYSLNSGTWNESSLAALEAQLAKTPCYATRRIEDVVVPKRKAPELLLARWGNIPQGPI